MSSQKEVLHSVHIESSIEKLSEIVSAKNKTDAMFKCIRKMNGDGVGKFIHVEKLVPIAQFNASDEPSAPGVR
jgi:hypothetical protein